MLIYYSLILVLAAAAFVVIMILTAPSVYTGPQITYRHDKDEL